MSKNYYKILGVNKNSTQEEIKKAYRKLCHQFHPDVGGDERAFKAIQEAYDNLNNGWFEDNSTSDESQYFEIKTSVGSSNFSKIVFNTFIGILFVLLIKGLSLFIGDLFYPKIAAKDSQGFKSFVGGVRIQAELNYDKTGVKYNLTDKTFIDYVNSESKNPDSHVLNIDIKTDGTDQRYAAFVSLDDKTFYCFDNDVNSYEVLISEVDYSKGVCSRIKN